MIQESSNKMGNHPLTHTLSPGATFMSSLVYSLNTLEMGKKKKKRFRKIIKSQKSLILTDLDTTSGTDRLKLAQFLL